MIKKFFEFVKNIQPFIKESQKKVSHVFLPVQSFINRFLKEMIIALILAVIVAVVIDKYKEDIDKKILDKNLKAVATIVSSNSEGELTPLGSGFFINGDGLLVTNNHVIEGNKDILFAKLPTGAFYKLKEPIIQDKNYDVAILQFDAKETPFVQMGDSDGIRIGDRVFAIGSSLGWLENSVSDGVISYPLRELANHKKLIQFTAAISSGNSGGGLFSKNGKAIGITSSSLTIPPDLKKDVDAQNLNFAVPINDIKKATSGNDSNVIFNKDSPDLYYSKGVIAENKKDYDNAIENFKKAIALDENYVDAYFELGNICYEKGLYDLEIQVFEKATKLVPNNSDGFSYLASAYEDKGQYNSAIGAYKKVLEIKPDDKQAIYQLGILYLVQGDKDKASNLISSLLKIDEGLGNELRMLIEKAK